MFILFYALVVVFLGGCDSSDTTSTTTPSKMTTKTFLGNYSSLDLTGPGLLTISAGNFTRLELQYSASSVGNVSWDDTSSTLKVVNKCSAGGSVCQTPAGSAGFVLKGTINYKSFNSLMASNYINASLNAMDSKVPAISDLHFNISKGSEMYGEIQASNSTRFILSDGSGVQGIPTTLLSSPYIEVMAEKGDSNYFGKIFSYSSGVVVSNNKKIYMQIGGANTTTVVTTVGEAVFNAQNCMNCNMHYAEVKSIQGTVGNQILSQTCQNNYTKAFPATNGGTALNLQVDKCVP